MSQYGSGGRSSRACGGRKAGKEKCNGNWPCGKCAVEGRNCVYGDNRRERQQRLLASSTQRNDVLATQLEKFHSQKRELLTAVQNIHTAGVDAVDHFSVAQLLAQGIFPAAALAQPNIFPQYEEAEEGDTADTVPSSSDPDQYGSTVSSARAPTAAAEAHGEELVSLSVGSPNSQGTVPGLVDLGHGAGASGLIGKLSEISWLDRARQHILQGANGNWQWPQSLDLERLAEMDMSYHLDEADILAVDEECVSEYQWPSMAATMAGVFFDTLYPTFPFVDKEQFLRKLLQLYHFQERHPLGERRHWLAMANVIFCLGSKWLMQGGANGSTGHEDHLMYYARARNSASIIALSWIIPRLRK
ncbi:hypothetical protein EDD36DRAFT_118260 [Exophiala viscosa]|uniref:Zn(2)-C6 fungal-type domain-containing protein n=1 Tax=Exophiala viscosa TaxID=2486360 RepID=A0AAN6DKY1_9EURO|nr:hypothetical protein EDD36DRAFT_118260 [Exophiala viscosa]